MYSDSNAHSRPTTTVKCDILHLTQSDSSTSNVTLLPVDSTTDSKFQLGKQQCHDIGDRKQTSTTTTKLSNGHAVEWQLTAGPTVHKRYEEYTALLRNLCGTSPEDPRQQCTKSEKLKVHDNSFTKHKKLLKNSS